LHLAATHGHSEIVKILLNHLDLVGGDKMNDEGQYPLHLASLKGHVEVVKLLLDANIPVDQKNRDSETALHVA
ncbi:ankyrin repeat-containing domain protein, partial [Kalaharituber pfeilii]